MQAEFDLPNIAHTAHMNRENWVKSSQNANVFVSIYSILPFRLSVYYVQSRHHELIASYLKSTFSDVCIAPQLSSSCGYEFIMHFTHSMKLGQKKKSVWLALHRERERKKGQVSWILFLVWSLHLQDNRTEQQDNRTEKLMEQQQQMFTILSFTYIMLDLKTVQKWKKQPIHAKFALFSLYFAIIT